jgi:hypothetical protein
LNRFGATLFGHLNVVEVLDLTSLLSLLLPFSLAFPFDSTLHQEGFVLVLDFGFISASRGEQG